MAIGVAACQTEGPQERPALEAPSKQEQAKPAPAPLPTPDRLIGKSDKEINQLYGKPSLKRRETGAQFWQYSDPGCLMDLYFYNDGGTQRVSYVNLRDPVTGRAGASTCQEKLGRLTGN